MLNFIFIFLFLINIPFNYLLAQKSGYENLSWGTSVDEVRKKYPNIERINDSDPDFNNSIKYVEKYSDGSIESREFVFWKSKLVKVLVTYSVDNIDGETLVNNFVNKFGKPIDTDSREEDVGYSTAKTYDFYWNDNGTRVILRAVSLGIYETVLALYISLKYSDEYKSEKSKDIGF